MLLVLNKVHLIPEPYYRVLKKFFFRCVYAVFGESNLFYGTMKTQFSSYMIFQEMEFLQQIIRRVRSVSVY